MGGEHAMEHYDVCIGPNLTCMNDMMNRYVGRLCPTSNSTSLKVLCEIAPSRFAFGYYTLTEKLFEPLIAQGSI